MVNAGSAQLDGLSVQAEAVYGIQKNGADTEGLGGFVQKLSLAFDFDSAPV